MASIENEIVRFVAEMELDAQDQAAFVEGLKKAEHQCESLLIPGDSRPLIPVILGHLS